MHDVTITRNRKPVSRPQVGQTIAELHTPDVSVYIEVFTMTTDHALYRTYDQVVVRHPRRRQLRHLQPRLW